MNEDQNAPVDVHPEPEPSPQKEKITVRIASDCMCFVADCPLHSEAAEMFLGLTKALNAAHQADIAIDSMSLRDAEMENIHTHVREVIAALELPLSRLSERVVLR